MPKTEKEAMTHDPVLHALIDLCQEITKKGPTVMWKEAKDAYARAMSVIRDHTAPGGESSPRYVPTRHSIIEECATAIESAPLTYTGPDPQGVRDLRYLIVCAIRALKRVPISLSPTKGDSK
jgi:hypothetical protein